jgi:hypothetical protein
MPLGDLCEDPSFLDAWGECFADLPLELLRTLALASRAWNARLLAHFLTCGLRVRFGKGDCTQANAAFLLDLARRPVGRMINRTLRVRFEGAEGAEGDERAPEPAPERWRDFDLHGWMQKHMVLRRLKPDHPLAAWVVEEDTPLAAAFLLGRAMALDLNQPRRRICVEFPFEDGVARFEANGEPKAPRRLRLDVSTLSHSEGRTFWSEAMHKQHAHRLSEVALTALAGCHLNGALARLKGGTSHLAFETQRLDDAGARAVERALRRRSATPRTLNLQNTVTKLSAGLLGVMCDLVPRGATFCTQYLNTLNLSSNPLGYRGIARLSRMFMSCRWRELPALKHLDLSYCAICGPSLEDHLAPCFATEMVLGGLQSLMLRGNSITNRGLAAFQSHATRMAALKRLDLGECHFTIGAAQDFATWLKRDAGWAQLQFVDVERKCGANRMSCQWQRAQQLVDLAVNVRVAERAWEDALPDRAALG